MSNKEKPAGLPEWAGNHPFPPDKKKPALLKSEDHVVTVYGSGKEMSAAELAESAVILGGMTTGRAIDSLDHLPGKASQGRRNPV